MMPWHDWLVDVFEKMGGNLSDKKYIRPAVGDVWDFLGKIKEWFI